MLSSDRARGVMLAILTALALVAALAQAKTLLGPIVFALVVGIVVSPLADRLTALGVPRVITAAGLLLVSTGLIVAVFIAVEPLLTSMAGQLPKIRAEVQGWIDAAGDMVRGIEVLSNEIEETVGAQQDDEDTAPKLPSVMDAVWLAPNIGATFFVFVGTLFFFTLTRTEIYAAAGRFEASLRRADRAVARYFATVTIVNATLGACVALVLALIGLPNALLWGLAAAGLNFILYLGPVVMFVALLVAGLVQFSGAAVILPPLAFLGLNIIEAQFVTPTVVGQRLEMNPLFVFLAIVFGLWFWGPIGAILALPVALWIGVVSRPIDPPEGPRFIVDAPAA
jgi:predicted PurR-regulated permease PerM